MKLSVLSWILRVTVAVILIQTLYFKFTGVDESIYIFSALGMEPFGKIGSGIADLIASILILMRRTILLGAMIALGVMTGAILSHLFVLGIEVQNDKGVLFILAVITFLCSSGLVYQHKNEKPNLLKF